MERLTFVDEDGQVLFDNPAGFPEDVGFTIRELAKNEEWEALDNIAQRLANCEQILKYYKDLEEQNRLIKLPCAVGDTVYAVMTYSRYVEEIVITGFSVTSNMIFMMCDEETGYREDLFGKTVFLTIEEAEAALKELERG